MSRAASDRSWWRLVGERWELTLAPRGARVAGATLVPRERAWATVRALLDERPASGLHAGPVRECERHARERHGAAGLRDAVARGLVAVWREALRRRPAPRAELDDDAGLAHVPLASSLLARSWVSIVLRDEELRPMAGARYRVKLPLEDWVEGTLDANGRAYFQCREYGVAAVEFPDFDDAEWHDEPEAEPREPPPPEHWVAVRLLDDEGRPMAGARYRMKLPRGGWIEGALDGDGRVRVEHLHEGACKFELPDFDDAEWYAGEPPPEPLEPPDPHHWVAVRLLDDDGAPMAGARYRLKTPGGGWIEGALDGEGRARVEQINAGVCKFELVDLDEADWAPA